MTIPDGDFDGFGAPVIPCGVLRDGFVHEKGAWVWRDKGKPIPWLPGSNTMERVPMSGLELETVRDDLRILIAQASDAIAVVNRQIERGDLREGKTDA